MKPAPPIWAERFLEWYCRPEKLEEIQGDIQELFQRHAKSAPKLARWAYVWNVARFFRLKNIRHTKKLQQANPLTMFSNYMLIGLRSALRNGMVSLINIGGLALGVGGAITIFIFADQWFHTDDFHLKRDRIYEIANVVNRDSTLVTLSDTPLLLGPMLQVEASSVENMTRIEAGSGALRYGDKVFQERIWFTDPGFFEMFTFTDAGVPENALRSPNGIVLASHIAEKYFGERDPVGQPMSVKFSTGKVLDFTVTGVAHLPENNTLHFNVVLSMEVFQGLKLKDAYNWDYLTDATFVLLKPGQTIESLEPLMAKYKKLQNESNPDWPITDFKFYSMEMLATQSGDLESYMIGSGEPQGVYTMSVIAFLLLLLACFNYTNIAVATVSARLKEIGIRKVVGGRKAEIVQQFIMENVMLCSFAILTGLSVSYFGFMPGISALVGYPIPFGFSSGLMGIYFFVGILLFIVMVSGVYPALYVSGFQPVQILKGKERFGQRSTFSRILLTCQFVVAFMTIVGCFVFIDQNLYFRRKDWGYDHGQNLVVPVNSTEQYLKLRDKVAGRRDIVQFAGAKHHVGSAAERAVLDYASQKFEMIHFGVGYDYLETMNMRLKEGRFFDRTMSSDSVSAVVVNEHFVDAMGWTSPLSQFFTFGGKQRMVIGVVRDFHHDDFYMGIRPALFSLAPEKDFRFLSMKAQEGTTVRVEQEMRELWKEIGPDDPYRGLIQDDVFYNFYRNTGNDMGIIVSVAVITLILACLGLFGLVSYNITRRLKEFSVRKVFGANLLHIFRLMNRDYVWILSIAFILGAPAGYFLMTLVINAMYPEPQPTGVVPFAIAIGMMALTVAITVGSQMSRVTRENPAQTLRSE